jgi:ATP:ADP antiporter, AAA family
MTFIQRMLSPIVQVRREEGLTVFLMFAYSFLAMTVWNTIKPLTRSQFIKDLGADNLPYVLLASGLVIGILMAGYVWLMARLPRKWGLPIVQAGMGGLLVVFWFLFEGYVEPDSRTGTVWVSVVFYLLGMIFGLLLISQFWTVANLVYDPRQAKRLFAFIGGGAPLGGFAGSALVAFGATRLGSVNLLLPSAALMLLLSAVTIWVISRERIVTGEAVRDAAGKEKGVSAGEALRLLQQSSHLKIIALVISFASIGAAIIEQQLNMAAEAVHGAANEDAISRFLGFVGLWMSAISFVVQIWVTSKILRYLGIGFALMILPVSLGATALVMLFNAALWAPSLARVLDQALRYSVDKTSREVLFLPLPEEIKLQAKSFVDVTVDRAARALGALMLVVLVQPWGLNLDWQRISYASLTMVGLWIAMALYARRGYLRAFRQSIERRDLAPSEVRLSGADLSTIETLVQELANPDAARVVYAIDVLESLDKRNLVTPLLLHHEAPEVRERALRALGGVQGPQAAEWLPQVRRLLDDDVPSVRAAAIRAVGAIGNEDAYALARPMTNDRNSRIRATAAVVLAGSESHGDVMLAEATLLDLCADTGEQGRQARRDVAAAIRGIDNPRFRRLLIPLLYDPDPAVAGTAMRSVREAGAADFLFVPTLVALLRHRQLKGHARDVLVSYGEDVIDPLAHFLRDQEEDIWVRRHIPATLARIPSQRSVDVLIEAIADPDGFLRFKAIAGLERLRHSDTPLTFPRGPVEKQAVREANHFFTYLSLHDNLFRRGGLTADSLLGQALEQKMDRARRRTYRLLSLIYPWKDIAAVQWTMERGDARARSSASEYLDNVLTGELRRRVMPLIEDLPIDEKVRRANVLVKTRPRDVEETLLQLINDEDQVVAASAIDLVRQAKLWSLGDDVEHVLAHRDARDWYVFEAASWALAERRMPAERRRELWLEPLPAAELAARLRALPMFAATSVDELFRLAGNARQIRHEAGEVLAQAGTPPEFVHLLLDGTVVAQAEGTPRTIEAPASLGLIEALQGQPVREGLRAGARAVTLALSVDDLRTLLSENTDLVGGLFECLSEHASCAGCGVVQLSTAATKDVDTRPGEPVRAVEKVLALERAALFARLSADEATHLATIAHTVPLTAGAPLFAESDPPAIWIVMSGEISLGGAEGPAMPVRAGDVLGALETLAGKPIGQAATVVREGVALRIDRDDLFELLGERPALLRQLFTGMFRMTGSQVELTSGVR